MKIKAIAVPLDGTSVEVPANRQGEPIGMAWFADTKTITQQDGSSFSGLAAIYFVVRDTDADDETGPAEEMTKQEWANRSHAALLDRDLDEIEVLHGIAERRGWFSD